MIGQLSSNVSRKVISRACTLAASFLIIYINATIKYRDRRTVIGEVIATYRGKTSWRLPLGSSYASNAEGLGKSERPPVLSSLSFRWPERGVSESVDQSDEYYFR